MHISDLPVFIWASCGSKATRDTTGRYKPGNTSRDAIKSVFKNTASCSAHYHEARKEGPQVLANLFSQKNKPRNQTSLQAAPY